MKKFQILKAEKVTLLDKRSELVTKCRHENKYYAALEDRPHGEVRNQDLNLSLMIAKA